MAGVHTIAGEGQDTEQDTSLLGESFCHAVARGRDTHRGFPLRRVLVTTSQPLLDSSPLGPHLFPHSGPHVSCLLKIPVNYYIFTTSHLQRSCQTNSSDVHVLFNTSAPFSFPSSLYRDIYIHTYTNISHILHLHITIYNL